MNGEVKLLDMAEIDRRNAAKARWRKVWETSWAMGLLAGMQRQQTFFYGMADTDEVANKIAKRRAKNKVARKTRKANRRSGAAR